MAEKLFYDITEVCKMLGTTSRALRFYEEKGIIQSTTPGLSSRRRYTKEQLDKIKKVLILRSLGLSVKTIAELQKDEADLKNAVLSKRAEIFASIDSRIKEIELLNEAIFSLESGMDIFSEKQISSPASKKQETEIAEICTATVLNEDTEILYQYLSPRLKEYMPPSVYKTVRDDTFAPLGTFVAVERISVDEHSANKIYSYVKFSKLGLKITFVFQGEEISGFWLGYYQITERYTK